MTQEWPNPIIMAEFIVMMELIMDQPIMAQPIIMAQLIVMSIPIMIQPGKLPQQEQR